MKTKKTENANLEKKRSLFFQIGLIVTIAVSLFVLEWSNSNAQKTVYNDIVGVEMEVELIPITHQDEKPKPPELKIENPKELIIDDNVSEENEIQATDYEKYLKQPTDIIIEDLIFDKEPVEIIDIPFDYAQIMPEFVGGETALMRYINSNINYPQIAIENDIQGKVYVKFIVNKEGKIENAEIVRSVHESLDKEALRIIQSMPEWKAGMNGNQAVSVNMIIPINFKLLDK